MLCVDRRIGLCDMYRYENRTVCCVSIGGLDSMVCVNRGIELGGMC